MTTTVESETVHFSIHGDFLTDHYRSLVREGEWRMAFEQMQETFTTDISLDLVIDILSGKKKMVGVNDIGIEDDDLYLDDEWLYDQYYTYFNNLIFHENKAYKAYMCVEHLMYDDMRKLKDMHDNDLHAFTKKEISEMRALTYAKSMTDDYVFHKDGGWIICERYDKDFPIWIKKNEIEDLMNRLDFKSLEYLMRINTKEDREFMAANSVDYGKNFEEVDYKDVQEHDDRIEQFFKNTQKAELAFERLDEIRAEITIKANENGGWLELYDEDTDKTFKLPRNAFYRWCLSNNSAWESIDWTPVSPRGMKMMGDDPNHTDWWLFTGYELCGAYNNDMMGFFYDHKDRIYKEITGHDFTTLLRGNAESKISCVVKHMPTPEDVIYDISKNDLVIVSNASPDFELIAHKCAENGGVLMTQVGGKLCHLATVGREYGLTLLMLPDALKLLPEGCKVTLDIDAGTIKADELDIETALRLKISGKMY